MRKKEDILKEITGLQQEFEKNAAVIRNNLKSILVKRNEQLSARIIQLYVELETK